MYLSCTDDDESQHAPPAPFLLLPLPFCPSRAEKQLTDTRGGNILSSFQLFSSFLSHFLLFSISLSHFIGADWNASVNMRTENCHVPKAGIQCLITEFPTQIKISRLMLKWVSFLVPINFLVKIEMRIENCQKLLLNIWSGSSWSCPFKTFVCRQIFSPPFCPMYPV